MSLTRLDANQIIQSVFDETTSSLKTIPSGATSFSIELDATDGDSIETRKMATETTHLNAVTAGADVNSTALDMLNYSGIMVAITWTGLNAANPTVKVQYSVDGTTYFDIDTTILSTASGSDYYSDAAMNGRYMRIAFAHGTNTTGTVTVKSVIKG